MSNNNIVQDRSTLTLLEHINLNVPNHNHILPFYFGVLGCGMDPRKAANLSPESSSKKTLWANAGPCQFHLPHGETAQRIPGVMGLRFHDDRHQWDAFVERACNTPAFDSCIQAREQGMDRNGKPFVRLVDVYGNVFMCRPDDEEQQQSRLCRTWKQPIITPDDKEWSGTTVRDYGRHESACSFIDFCEFLVPPGTANKIALFYDSVFDATTSVVMANNGDDKTTTSAVAIVAFGNVRANGQADQSLLFRETDKEIPPYDGHHIAMYVGSSAADFEQAYKNAELTRVVWINPRFSDKADTLEKARQWKQFRFKDIVDMETGETIFELEHEMRSCEHEAWPGERV